MMLSPIGTFDNPYDSSPYAKACGPGQTIGGMSGYGFPRSDSQAVDGRRASGSGRDSEMKSVGVEGPGEKCQTCATRKYQDGSNEMVSFKSPQHISPESAASAVRAHEQEHVSNAYKKAAMGNGKVVFASVAIHMDVCPECGRSYVSGGTTQTKIKYSNEDNPYQRSLKTADWTKYAGMNLDYNV